jgi:hypothetical protein
VELALLTDQVLHRCQHDVERALRYVLAVHLVAGRLWNLCVEVFSGFNVVVWVATRRAGLTARAIFHAKPHHSAVMAATLTRRLLPGCDQVQWEGVWVGGRVLDRKQFRQLPDPHSWHVWVALAYIRHCAALQVQECGGPR